MKDLELYVLIEIVFRIIEILLISASLIFAYKGLRNIGESFKSNRGESYINTYYFITKIMNTVVRTKDLNLKLIMEYLETNKEDILAYGSERTYSYYFELIDWISYSSGKDINKKKEFEVEALAYRMFYLLASLKEDYMGDSESDLTINSMLVTHFKHENIYEDIIDEIQENIIILEEKGMLPYRE